MMEAFPHMHVEIRAKKVHYSQLLDTAKWWQAGKNIEQPAGDCKL